MGRVAKIDADLRCPTCGYEITLLMKVTAKYHNCPRCNITPIKYFRISKKYIIRKEDCDAGS